MLGSCGRCERASVCFRRFDRVSIFSIEQFLKKKKKRLIIYYCITSIHCRDSHVRNCLITVLNINVRMHTNRVLVVAVVAVALRMLRERKQIKIKYYPTKNKPL